MEPIGLQELILESIFGLLLDWWWMVALVVVIAILNGFTNGKRSRRSRKLGYSGEVRRRYRAASGKSWQRGPIPKARFGTASNEITGKAYVTDGDGIRVGGKDVRIVGIDAPEWDQLAKQSNDKWINHGKAVKSVLIGEIGGKHVRVLVEGTDRFGRLLGTVIHQGRDIGEWLVSGGHARALYDDRYTAVEREARKERRGMWAHAHNFDPRAHRHRQTRER